MLKAIFLDGRGGGGYIQIYSAYAGDEVGVMIRIHGGGGHKRRKLLKITLGGCEYHNQSQINGHSNFLLNSNMKGRVKSWAS